VRWAGGVGAGVPLLALVFVLATLIIEALPAIRLNGLHFFTATAWDPGNTYGETAVTDGVAHPVGAYYGALPLIVGTLATSAIALIIAVPVSIGAALVIVERLPKRLATAVGMTLELLAGIPSVIVGLWGAMTFGPFIAHNIAPVIARNKIVLKSATPGIVTGMLVALALAIGETAPMLYTAAWSNSLPTGQLINSPVGYPTYPIWTFYNQPSETAHALSYDAALLLIVFVLLLIILGRLVTWFSRRHSES